MNNHFQPDKKHSLYMIIQILPSIIKRQIILELIIMLRDKYFNHNSNEEGSYWTTILPMNIRIGWTF